MGWWQRKDDLSKSGSPGDAQVHDYPPPIAAAMAKSERSPAEDVAIARFFLKRKDLRLALHYLSLAIALEPGKLEWIEALDDWIAAAGEDVMQYFPPQDPQFTADSSVHAYVLAVQGEFQPALAILSAVLAARPAGAYLEAWVFDWLASDEVLLAVDPELIGTVLAARLLHYPEHGELPKAQREYVKQALAILDRCAAKRGPDLSHEVLRSALLRKLGRFQEAYEVARQAHAKEPSYATAIPLAVVLRSAGHTEKAVAAYQTALRDRPDDVAVRLDLGDLYLADERWKESLHWYEEALEHEPENAWALAGVYYCRSKLTRDKACVEKLKRLADQQGKDSRAGCLNARQFPFVGYLPEPLDATANVLRAMIQEGREALEKRLHKTLILDVGSLEAPSLLLAFAKQMESMGIDCRLQFNVRDLPSPDPRKPMTRVQHLLWRYEGTIAEPGLSRPREDVARAVARLAREPFEPERNWRMAWVVAESLGTEASRDALAVMVHPPAIQGGVTSLVWVPRVQLVAAQVLAQIDSGWKGSLSRDILFDVARGPMDWTTNAAIIALRQVACEAPSTVDDIRGLFHELLEHAPVRGFCCYRNTLLANWQMIPGVPEAERRQVAKLWAANNDEA